MTENTVHVIGGGTRFHIDSHLYLGSKAMGNTARQIAKMCERRKGMEVKLHLTAMAEPIVWMNVDGGGDTPELNPLDTNEDMKRLVLKLVDDPKTKIVFWNTAIVDFHAELVQPEHPMEHEDIVLGKNTRLRTRDDYGWDAEYTFRFTPTPKLLNLFRQGGEGRQARKDIFLVAFKQTSGASEWEQYEQGLDLLKRASANLVLANDSVTRLNMIIVPEEAAYSVTNHRERALRDLVEMAYLRSELTFTQSTVVDGNPIPWNSDIVPASLRTVVDHCIMRGAYKPVRGATAGHFAVKIGEGEFLTSRRKTNYNHLDKVGLVRIESVGPNEVIAYGSKPSVGGQSQRIVFAEHPEADCIVHFHCPPKSGSVVPNVPQRPYECGSHECGANTSHNLAQFGNMLAVNLENHGPNIVFNRNVDPWEVISFIEANFDLTQKSGGFAIS